MDLIFVLLRFKSQTQKATCSRIPTVPQKRQKYRTETGGQSPGAGEGGKADSKGCTGKLAGVELFCEGSCGAGLESGTAGCTQAYFNTCTYGQIHTELTTDPCVHTD